MKTKKEKILPEETLKAVLVITIIFIVIIIAKDYIAHESNLAMKLVLFLAGGFFFTAFLFFLREEKIVSRDPKNGELIKVLHIEEIKEETKFGSRKKFLILYSIEETIFLTYRKPEATEKCCSEKIKKGEYIVGENRWGEIEWGRIEKSTS